MTIAAFISAQLPERQKLLTAIHEIIVKNDHSVKAEVAPMMGKEMILYNAPGTFKYGLASTNKYMSLHALPIYVLPVLHARYAALLPKASLQKGCINFKDESGVPLDILKEFIKDCSAVDLVKIREDQMKSKKAAKK